MKIVHILESTATGTLSMVCLIANGLVEEGHDVEVIYSLRPDTPEGLSSLFDEKVKLRHVQMKNASLLRTLATLRSTLRQLDPDIVHLHSSFAGFLGRISTLMVLRRTAFFYSPHCISFMRRDISRLKRIVFVSLERFAGLRRCVYVACSESERLVVRRSLRQPVELVENAVGTSLLNVDASETGACQDGLCVLTVGGVRAQKNPALFAQIARRLAHRKLRFVWIGDGDEELKRDLREAGVEVTGWLEHAQAMRWLGRTDVYLSTSSWEGMPVSVVEAMMAGRPVVVSDCAGNIDVVRHLETGAIFSNADEGAALVERIVDDPVFRSALASRARSEAQLRFSKARFFEQLAPVYEDELRRRKRTHSNQGEHAVLRRRTT